MAILIKIDEDTFNSLDESLQSEYTKPEGADHYLLADAVTGAWESGDAVSGLKSSLHKERENARAAGRMKHELREAQELAEKHAADLAVARELNSGSSDLQTQFEALQGQFVSLNKTLSKERTARTISEVSQNNKGNIALRDHLALRVKTDPESGNAIVTDPENDNAPILDTDGKAISPDAYVKQLKALSDTQAGEQYGLMFYGTGSSGGGSVPGSGKGSTFKGTLSLSGVRRSKLSAKDKIALIREHGDKVYQGLPL